MAFDFDTSKLSQVSARKVTPHDNCVVLDLGTGAFPRDIEVRLPDDDGARQTALWDGGLDLAINDEVLCHEYAGLSAWRVFSMGGNESGAGQVRVNKVWAEDFTSESLVTDASDNVTINTGTLTLPSDIIHLSDIDTKISFDTDDIEFTAGGLSMLKLTEAGQDLITLGPGSGDVDIDFNGDMFLQGSDGNFGIATASPLGLFQIGDAFIFETDGTGAATNVNLTRNAWKDGATWRRMVADNDALLMQMDSAGNFSIAGNTDGGTAIDSAITFAGRFIIEGGTGKIGINGVFPPSTELDIGPGAIEFDEMTAPGAGAANTARLFARDNGASKTQLCVQFATGGVIVLATEV